MTDVSRTCEGLTKVQIDQIESYDSLYKFFDEGTLHVDSEKYHDPETGDVYATAYQSFITQIDRGFALKETPVSQCLTQAEEIITEVDLLAPPRCRASNLTGIRDPSEHQHRSRKTESPGKTRGNGPDSR